MQGNLRGQTPSRGQTQFTGDLLGLAGQQPTCRDEAHGVQASAGSPRKGALAFIRLLHGALCTLQDLSVPTPKPSAPDSATALAIVNVITQQRWSRDSLKFGQGKLLASSDAQICTSKTSSASLKNFLWPANTNQKT